MKSIFIHSPPDYTPGMVFELWTTNGYDTTPVKIFECLYDTEVQVEDAIAKKLKFLGRADIDCIHLTKHYKPEDFR